MSECVWGKGGQGVLEEEGRGGGGGGGGWEGKKRPIYLGADNPLVSSLAYSRFQILSLQLIHGTVPSF